MPGTDGIAATKAIRALGGGAATVPIVALTANAMVGDREKDLSMGANDYISKPIEATALFDAIARCCGTERNAATFDPPLAAKPGPDPASEIDAEASEFLASLDALVDPPR